MPRFPLRTWKSGQELRWEWPPCEVRFAAARQRLVAGSLSDAEAQTDAEVHGQAGVADGGDVLFAEEIIALSVDGEARKPLVADSEIELGEGRVEIAIGQEKRVSATQIRIFQIGRVVAAAGECAGGNGRDFAAGVAGGDVTGVWGPTEWTRALERRDGSDFDAVIRGNRAEER